MKLAETDIGRAVVIWLQTQHYDVYQEVRPSSWGHRADIVATIGQRVWIVECKTSLSLAVLGQAYGWRDYANWISVAVPWSRRRGRGHFSMEVARRFGIGVIEVNYVGRLRECYETVSPRLCRKPLRYLRDALCDAHKTYADAGSQAGYFTSFKQTARALREIVEKCPGQTLSECIGQERFHYASASSARSALGKWLRDGLIDGVEVRRDGRHLRLFPME